MAVVIVHAKWCRGALVVLFWSFSNSLNGLVVVASGELLVRVILEQVELHFVFLLLRNLKVLVTWVQLVYFKNHKSTQILGS